jgi:monothiol glutaredoxin
VPSISCHSIPVQPWKLANLLDQGLRRQALRPATTKAASFPATASPFRPQPFLSAFQARLLSDETRSAIDKAVASAPVVLFMKGTPETPACGFSRAAIQILGLQGVDPNAFAAFNVLEDPELRAGIKEYSDWPTIPQLYVDKEFVGGCDILVSMHQSGDLAKLFEEKKVVVLEGEGEGEKPSQ